MRLAIRKHWKDFAAIVGLIVIAAVVGGIILGHQRLYLPKWVPGLGTDFVDYKAQFTTGQSLTPGQGQTVQIAGVNIGEISNVDLVDGRAVVTMKIRHKYTPIYKDATALLRPKTGLNDMVIELTPGTKAAGAAPAGFTIPVSQTLPNVNVDEILASLDADTRSYLQLLLGGTGEALAGQGKHLSATLKRFEPTGRYLSELNGALALRDRNIRRVIHNFGLLTQAVGDKDRQLAALVNSSNAVFQTFASQDLAIRRSLRLLPSTLAVTNASLVKVNQLGKVLGPSLDALLPGAQALGPSLQQTRRFFNVSTPIIQHQLRPFARDSLPVVKVLRPTAANLAKVTPSLTSSLKVANYLLNELAYDPPGRQEGYLFWASWLNHLGTSLFNLQDANGPVRRGLVMASCSSLQTLANIGKANQVLGVLAQLLNPPSPSQVCGKAFG